MTAPGYLVVANKAAGTTAQDRVQRAVDRLETSAPTTLCWTSEPEELRAIVDDLDDRVLVVAGGDGSVKFAVDTVAAAGRLDDIVVGLLPLGTGNNTARGNDIPLDPEGAADVICAGRTRGAHLLVINGELGVNAAHVGLGAVAADASSTLKPVLGNAAYTVTTVAAGLSEEGWDTELVVDGGEPRRVELLLAAMMLGPRSGPGTLLAPDADLAHPTFELLVVDASGRADRLGMALDFLRERQGDRDDVHLETARTLHVRSERPIPLSIDGEVHDGLTEVDVAVRPSSWTLIVP
ncbi:MAG: diacylglycerol kinase family protein [Actinomycetota bacterium]|nr:diacylglycerol kinase family protein [Actinomycetota bacterium]